MAITVEQAGPYAAFLTTSFMIGRTLTAHCWGRLADIYGRRIVSMASLTESGLACIWFGMASTYSGLFGAIIARGVIGAWNSIVGVTKTYATELAYYEFDNGSKTHDVNSDQRQKEENRIVGMVMSMRAWGFLVAPAIAGFLADPLMVRENTGSSNSVLPNTRLLRLLYKYPYLLPNLLGAVLCWSAAVAVYFIVPETLERQKQDYTTIPSSVYPNGTYGSLEDVDLDRNNDDDTKCCWHISKTSNTTGITSIWSRRNTGNHLIAYWLSSFVIISIDEAFPLYCIARNNGVGQLNESDIGTILSISGIIFAVGKFHIYTWIVDRFGLYASLSFGCWLGIVPISLIPCAYAMAHLSSVLGVTIYLALLIGMTKIFQSAFFSAITVATNRTVRKQMRSSMNGLGGVGAGGAKALGPLVTGYWMAICLSMDDGDKMYGGVIALLD